MVKQKLNRYNRRAINDRNQDLRVNKTIRLADVAKAAGVSGVPTEYTRTGRQVTRNFPVAFACVDWAYQKAIVQT